MIALLLTTLLAWQPIEAWQDAPTRANRIAYVCFKITGKRLIQCLYIGDNGLVDQTAILPLEKDL